ncbi:MAG: L-serine ammonia-lyase, iron-sulfur-dependent, subunit alpha [Patescibacteria group bacterium]|nr:L-serine ammonia-lyase, iron-sulfur-dependent, subunit alpha [Patescibacteria group bacterium]
MKHTFTTGKELLKFTKKHKVNISDAMLLYEISYSGKTEEWIKDRMLKRYEIMKAAIYKGVKSTKKSASHMSGGNAKKMFKEIKNSKKYFLNRLALKAISYAIATGETNACMGRIVAFPTAGASGVVPSLLVALEEDQRLSKEKILDALFNAAGIGLIIAENATLAGAEGGCQAEIGSAAAMAASAVTEIHGGTPEQCLNAAALALKNMLGLACDPIGGMVEVPCIKRNAFAAMYALTASDMTMAGIESYVPFDEVVVAMRNIGKLISSKLRETAMGGLAVTKTGENVKKKLGFKENGN